MRYYSREIKDLCIAKEALSRIPDSYHMNSRIDEILDVLLLEYKEEVMKPIQAPTLTPAPKPNDEIPF